MHIIIYVLYGTIIITVYFTVGIIFFSQVKLYILNTTLNSKKVFI